MILGIDLGTTNSLIARTIDGTPEIITDGNTGTNIVPSVVHFGDDGTTLVGHAARHATGGTTVSSVKRLMGIGLEHVNTDDRRQFPLIDGEEGPVALNIHGQTLTPPQISAHVLKELKRRAEEVIGEPLESVVITVPAYFNDSQRQATRDAGRMAGLKVLRLVNEPTAASLAYGLDRDESGIIAVYDLGGGTFDISILKLEGGIFEVLATSGDTHLGGDDMDRAFAAWIIEGAAESLGRPELNADDSLWMHAHRVAEEAKLRLSKESETVVRLEIPGLDEDYRVLVTRDDFESLVKSIAERTTEPCRLALKDAGLSPADINQVVMVGGSTRTPLVRQVVRDFFGREPLVDINPDEVVARGAAVQADILAGGRRDVLLLDVVPLSLGIETMGGVMTRLIHRNSKLPFGVTSEFTTPADNVTHIDIHVLQGEREMATDNRSLARFKLPVDPAPAGVPRVEVMFLIDSNGILSVTATDQRTGTEHTVEIKPSYGLTDEQVEEMLIESFDMAEEDIEARLLSEARVEADSMLIYTYRAMKEAAALIDEGEDTIIEASVGALEHALKENNRDAIIEYTQMVNMATGPLAKKMMDRTVQELVKEKTVDEVIQSSNE